MRTYHVRRPDPDSSPILEALAALVVVAAVMAVAYRPYCTIRVCVDGRIAEAAWGSTAGDLLDSGVTRAAPGDLVTADNRSVITTGAGGPVSVAKAGSLVPASVRVYPDDNISYAAGEDVVEPTITTETVTQPPVIEIGTGPIVEVLDEGSPRRVIMTVGAVSGRVVSSTVVSEIRAVRVARSGGTGGLKVVALTFDDGPAPGQTERVLGILDRYDVKATFFMLGANAEKYPALARRVADAGHQVGNHTWSHKTNASSTWKTSMSEIQSAQNAIVRATGKTPRWYRPPGGGIGQSMADAAAARKLHVAMWSVDPWDWRRPGVVPIVQRTITAVKPGAVVLLHDGGGDRSQTVAALEPIIRDLRRKGYTFVTLDELAEIRSSR